MNEAKDSCPAADQPSAFRSARHRRSSGFETEVNQRVPLGVGSPTKGRRELEKALGDNGARARTIRTAETPHPETEPDRPIGNREVDQRSFVKAVDPRRSPLADWASSGLPRGRHDDDQLILLDDKLAEAQANEGGNKGRKAHAKELLV